MPAGAGPPGAGPSWEEAAAFLARPDGPLGPVEVIETHTARILLSPDRAWKLRRPVDYGWLDYAGRARRRLCAEREIAWNGPAAPGLYLGLAGVAAGPRLIGPDEPVPAGAEPLVVMRRFDQDALFDRLAAAGRLDEALMRRTGAAVARMHRAAPAVRGTMRLPAMAQAEAGELAGLAPALGRGRAAELGAALQAEAARLGPLAATRGLRRCHGDLHLRNIVLWRGEPAPFDCIEFNAAFAQIDPLYDLAFLLMDLDHRGQGALGPAVLSAWAEGMSRAPGAQVGTAWGGLGLLRFYKGCRAAIRAKIAAIAARDADPQAGAEAGAMRAEAASYAGLALGLLAPAPPPRLVAVGGLSGSGKSVLARALAARLGAVHLRSDAVRKGLAGAAQTDRLGPAGYAPAMDAAVRGALRVRAGLALAGGMSVVLDATHLAPADRAGAEALARRAGCGFAGLWLDAPAGLLAARVGARRADASDATVAVLAAQIARGTGPVGWARLDAAGLPETVLAAALARLGPDEA